MTGHRAFFGDAEYSFRLTAPLIFELERSTGAAIGALCNRIFNREFAHSDLTEMVRLALIGGGTKPDRAAQLVATYAAGRPLSEVWPLASTIAEHVWFGSPEEKPVV